MNPVILATVAMSLLAVGTVSMSSLSAQQAASSANVQKVALERDRLAEQVNAYISAVGSSGPDTLATIKNTGSSVITIDHCLALSPQANSIRPTAARVAVSQALSPGATLDVALSGNLAADNIKCVTSKGTVLPVRLAAAMLGDMTTTTTTTTMMSDPSDYIDSFGVMADVDMASTQHLANSAYSPWEKPPQPPQGKGSLTYEIPVSKPITVDYVAREAPDGTLVEVVPDGGSGVQQYGAGQTISVPITGPTNRLIVKFTPQEGAEQQLTAAIRPNFVGVSALTGNSKSSSGSASIGVSEGQRYNPATFQSWTDWVAAYSFTGTKEGGSGLVGANGWIRNPQPSEPLVCSGTALIDGKGYCANMPSTLHSSPEIVQIYSFPAPKSTVKVTLYYDASARFSQTNCHLSYCNGGMSIALDLGQGGVVSTNVERTDNPGKSCPYSNSCYDYNDYYYAFTRSASVAFMLTDLTPGQQVDIPVVFRSNISSDNGTAYLDGYRYDKGAINYTGSIATQLFID